MPCGHNSAQVELKPRLCLVSRRTSKVCSGSPMFHIEVSELSRTILTALYQPQICSQKLVLTMCRKDRTLDGGDVMLLIHKDIPHMQISELENGSESVWVKVFANKTSHFVASWYRPPDSKVQKCR